MKEVQGKSPTPVLLSLWPVPSSYPVVDSLYQTKDQLLQWLSAVDRPSLLTPGLRAVHIEDFFPDWDRGFQRVLRVINSQRGEIKEKISINTRYEYRCAIVDLDNGLTILDQICQKLNAIQHFFHFSFPRLALQELPTLEFDGEPNLYLKDLPKSFFKQKVLLNSDLVCCLTSHQLAYEEESESGHNFLSMHSDVDDTFFFISTHGLYDRARKAHRTFEKAVVYNILTQLLVHFASGLEFHTEIRGCILDYCEEHSWMIKGLKAMKLCSACAKLIKNEEFKSAALAILVDPLNV